VWTGPDKPVFIWKTLPIERCRVTFCVVLERKYTNVDRTFPLVDDFKNGCTVHRSTVVLQAETVKYLGLHFDKSLTWKNHVAKKRKQLDLETRKNTGSLENIPPLSLENKLLISKTVLKPVWTYGIELWGCDSKSSIAIIQRYQSKLLSSITNAPWYVSNRTLHSDLHIPHVHTVFRERTATHRTALDSHPNPLMEPLVHPPKNRRLKRSWTFDEIH